MDQQTLIGGPARGGTLPVERPVIVEEFGEEPGEGGENDLAGEDERHGVLVEEEEMVAAVEEERGEKRGKGRARRAIVGLGVLLFIVAGLAVGVWLTFGKGATRKAKVPVNAGNTLAKLGSESEDAMTQQAIEQASQGGPGIGMSDGSVVRPVMLQPNNGVHDGASGAAGSGTVSGSNVPVTWSSPETSSLNGELSKPGTSNGPSTDTGESSGSEEDKERETRTAVTAGGRNSERSVRIDDVVKPTVDSSRGAANRGAGKGSVEDEHKSATGVVLPSFGAMLPVKTLGVLYTLRSGGLVRLELTRDLKGKGWSMSRGTVLVGTLRGVEYDRAFVSLVGFIDPETGAFVKVSGDILGADGGAGIRGKRRKMSGLWSRALARLGDAGLNIAGSLAGSIGGRRPIVINDAFGGFTGRVTNELEGALTGRDRNSFVEVAAGSTGYIMITELPDLVQGVDALAKLPSRVVKELSDVDEVRHATGISESELAELIESGDVKRIKVALPRMSAEMRRVAEAVIGGDLRNR